MRSLLTDIHIMKTEHTNLTFTRSNKAVASIISVTGAALCLTLSSCIIPVEDHSRGTTTYTTYQPGYRTTTLPSGYRSENISGRTYYYHDGAYYSRDSNGYIITDAPRESRYYSDYDRVRQTRTTTSRTYVR